MNEVDIYARMYIIQTKSNRHQKVHREMTQRTKQMEIVKYGTVGNKRILEIR